ncbi:hypothetical protein K458DRAFT_414611 [Lentithecium fluviatile CBS 122367]|uniref:2EXR domain-containing protein n=1 Tax=Lentithecium fluviatile CBS 122367 TaxID=1168545 RepID=A0A6G1JFJ3_9PLEO|nr:hypothetical protein K458DRAFT_414611 [Lentithecium fluviatile CBS 122367]
MDPGRSRSVPEKVGQHDGLDTVLNELQRDEEKRDPAQKDHQEDDHISVADTKIEQPSPSFSFFGKLPAELRVGIWHYALNSAISPRPPIIRQISHHPYTAKEKPPPLLHVNREARYEASKYYTQHTITFHSPHYSDTIDPAMILFFSPRVETLFLHTTPKPQAREISEECDCPKERHCCDPTNPVHSRAFDDFPFYVVCACPRANLPNRQSHLLRHFRYADTSAIKRVALYFDHHDEEYGEVVPYEVRAAFPAATSVTLAVPLKPPPVRNDLSFQCYFPATLWDIWDRYRNATGRWRLHYTRGTYYDAAWRGVELRVWVSDEAWKRWWELVDGEDGLSHFCRDYKRGSSRIGYELDVLLNGGLDTPGED